MQGADSVNDELEVGFDDEFERRWRLAERIGHVVMAIFIVAGLAGLFGRGPCSHRTAASAASGLSADFEPVTRSQTPTTVTLHVDNPTTAPAITVFIGTTMIEPMGLHGILPQPLATQAVQGGLLLTVAVPPGTRDAKIRLMLEPLAIGPVALVARTLVASPRDHPALHWTQVVFP